MQQGFTQLIITFEGSHRFNDVFAGGSMKWLISAQSDLANPAYLRLFSRTKRKTRSGKVRWIHVLHTRYNLPELRVSSSRCGNYRPTFFHLLLSNKNRVIQPLYTTSVAHKHRNGCRESIWKTPKLWRMGKGMSGSFSPTKVVSVLGLIPLFK